MAIVIRPILLIYAVFAIPTIYITHLVLLHFYAGVLGVSPDGWSLQDLRYSFTDPRPPPPPATEPNCRPPPPPPPDKQDRKPTLIYTSTSRPLGGLQRPLFEPVSEPGRDSDVIDTFANYTHEAQCGLNSLDLHMPFSPLCSDKASLLEAMSNGGRPGYDMPYIPLGCDMRWYSSQEVCAILDRFSHIFIIGDSLQRHLITALYILLRQDVGLGGIRDWELGDSITTQAPSKDFCMCSGMLNTHNCSDRAIERYAWVQGNDSDSLSACSGCSFDLSYNKIQAYPIMKENLATLKDSLPHQRPAKPPVFVLHHTHWNQIDLTATQGWLAQIDGHLRTGVPWLKGPLNRLSLYMTGSSGGLTKGWAGDMSVGRGDLMANFELGMRAHVKTLNMDFLGMWNMSAQTTQHDSTHANLGTNLLKAQMVLNWLDRLDIDVIWDDGH